MKKKTGGLESHKIKSIRLTDLVAAGYNPRAISEEAMAGLTRSLTKFGCVEPIVVNIRGGKKRIVGGHQRVTALIAMHGEEYKAPCVTVNLKPADEKLLNIALNNPHIQGEFTEDLAVLIDTLRGQVSGDDLIGLRIEQLRAELGELELEGQIPDDDIPTPPKKAKTKPGDMWLLGNHRLLCGDSTKEADVRRLMGRQRASLMVTDPPYIVDYTNTKRPNSRGHDWSNEYHEIEEKDGPGFLREFLSLVIENIAPKTALYIWHACRRRGMIDAACVELGILVHQQIVWVKPAILMTYSVYCWQHEPCVIMWCKGQRPPWNKSQKAIGTVWPVGYDRTGDPATAEYYTDVWELDWNGKKRRPNTIEHPTVKPVEIFAIPMRVHTKRGDICYEPFSGSGTQIIAAEKLGRKCYAMELEPVFVDVAVKRWEQWTGKRGALKARK